MAGAEKDFVDTQGVSLVANSVTYTQLINLDFDINSNVTKHQLTDDTIDNVFSLHMNYIEADITLTTGELAGLVTLSKDVSGVRPKHDWVLSLNDSSTVTKTLTLKNGQLKTLRVIDSGISVVKVFVRIEGNEDQTIT